MGSPSPHRLVDRFPLLTRALRLRRIQWDQLRANGCQRFIHEMTLLGVLAAVVVLAAQSVSVWRAGLAWTAMLEWPRALIVAAGLAAPIVLRRVARVEWWLQTRGK